MEKRSRQKLQERLEHISMVALRNNVFSACSIGYFRYGDTVVDQGIHHFGTTESFGRGLQVSDSTIFDLASLTKPLVTVLAFMALAEKGKIRLGDELGMFIPGLKSEMARIPLHFLLSHSSGLPAHRPYYRMIDRYPQEERKKIVLRLICEEMLVFQPGKGTLYSDLGYILLGHLIELTTGEKLSLFWEEEIVRPMGLQRKLFFPGPGGLDCDSCAATGTCSWSNRRLCGIVHDDNCRMLGGEAGHAGLFGTAAGVLSLIKFLLLQYQGVMVHPSYGKERMKEFLQRRAGSTWTYGFDTPTPGSSSSGSFFSEETVGHLGFTGTSFWLDLKQGVGVVLLTNRVLMGDDPSSIRRFRPLLHDTVMRILLEEKRPD